MGEVSIPLLVVGTKVDEANGSRLPLHKRRSDIAEELGTESSIGPGTSAATKLSRFFDKVITRQFYTDPRRSSVSNNVVITSDRRHRTQPGERNIMMDIMLFKRQ